MEKQQCVLCVLSRYTSPQEGKVNLLLSLLFYEYAWFTLHVSIFGHKIMQSSSDTGKTQSSIVAEIRGTCKTFSGESEKGKQYKTKTSNAGWNGEQANRARNFICV